jgi:transcription elongation factor Elf1
MPQLPYTPTCPSCNKELDGYESASPDRRVPQSGDITVCVYCSAVSQYTDAQTLRPVDVATLPPDVRKRIARAIALVRQVQHNIARRN